MIMGTKEKDMIIYDISVLQTRIGEIMTENEELIERLAKMENEIQRLNDYIEEAERSL